jgi:hypothetical protein
MLVLKSEDVFECPQEMLKRVLDFLELPVWTPTDPTFRIAATRAATSSR